MNKVELIEHCQLLDISAADAAQLLGVSERTVRRWMEGEEVPGPAEQALRAWRRLHERKLAWRPDSVALDEDDRDLIAAHRRHAVDLAAVLERVKARGGPQQAWLVDREGGRAILGPMEVGFYKLANGSFSLSNYTRKDIPPDARRDQDLIDDATYFIADAMERDAPGPATLLYMTSSNFVRAGQQAGSMRHEEFPSVEPALERAFMLIDQDKAHSFVIRRGTANGSGVFLWSDHELRAEYDRRMSKGRMKRRV